MAILGCVRGIVRGLGTWESSTVQRLDRRYTEKQGEVRRSALYMIVA
jgi:hypothetical protein